MQKSTHMFIAHIYFINELKKKRFLYLLCYPVDKNVAKIKNIKFFDHVGLMISLERKYFIKIKLSKKKMWITFCWSKNNKKHICVFTFIMTD